MKRVWKGVEGKGFDIRRGCSEGREEGFSQDVEASGRLRSEGDWEKRLGRGIHVLCKNVP